jgi:colanic acid/amylovoran biosynthesis glycosyltransferase
MNMILSTPGASAKAPQRNSELQAFAKVLYITAETPYGTGEVWALDEMLALLEAGGDLWVAPRTARGKVFHAKAAQVFARSISIPLVSARVVRSFADFVFAQPRSFLKSLSWTREKSVNLNEFAKSLAVLPKAWELARVAREFGFQHIHAHSTTTVAVVAWAVAQQLGCPYSFTLHSSFPLENPAIAREIIRRQFATLTDSAQFVRTISANIADKLLDLIGQSYASKIVVLPLGVDCNVTRNSSARSKHFTLISPAVLMAHKGHAIALEACRILQSRGVRDFQWIFCGDGPLRKDIEDQIAARGLTSTIHVWGNVPNDRILQMYSSGAVDATVLPSIAANGIYEGIPHALMQAMSYRIPVISTDSGSTLELIGGGAGVFVPQKDPNALAEAIFRLISDEGLCKRQGEIGYEKVSQKFNKRETVGTLLQLFSQTSQTSP